MVIERRLNRQWKLTELSLKCAFHSAHFSHWKVVESRISAKTEMWVFFLWDLLNIFCWMITIVNFCFNFVAFYWSTKKLTAVFVASIQLSMVGILVRNSVYQDKLVLLIYFCTLINVILDFTAIGVVCTKSIPLCIAKGKHCLNQSKFFIINGKGIFFNTWLSYGT